MSYPWIIDIDSPNDPRKGIKVAHIISGNDGDVCNSCVTYHLLSGDEPKYCIDIGVDEGWWSFFAASVNPNCKLDAFEPNPVSYKALLPYLVEQNQITLHNLAISDCEGGTIPFTIEGGQSNSRSHSEYMVPCTRLDKYIRKPVSLIKIDTEGHEMVILKTLRPYLDNIEAIIFEFSVYWYGTSKGECVSAALEELTFLKSHYNYMYVLSRRGNPELYEIIDDDEIYEFIVESYDLQQQVDIVVSNKPITVTDEAVQSSLLSCV